MEHPDQTGLAHHKLDGISAYREAIDTLIRQAHRTLRIFDYNLADGGYNTPLRQELLRAFLLASRANRLTLILHDTDYLLRGCPRLLTLLDQFSHAVEIRQTTADAKNVYDPFIIADEAHCLHRFHYDHPRALLALNDPEKARTLSERFAEIREASEPAAPLTPLGL